MFETLIESSAPGSTTAFPRLVALSVHGILTIGAIIGSHAVSAPRPTPVAVPITIYEEPAPGPATTSATTAQGPTVTAAPAAPDLPVMVPDRVSLDVPALGNALPKTGARELAFSDLPHGLGPMLEGPGDAVHLAAEVDEPATVIRAQAPVYPPAMASAGIAGKVSLEFVVDTLGRAEEQSVRVVGEASPMFERAARTSILGSLYRPARARGRTVRQLVRQSVVFRPEGGS
jgi:TonB family protein